MTRLPTLDVPGTTNNPASDAGSGNNNNTNKLHTPTMRLQGNNKLVTNLTTLKKNTPKSRNKAKKIKKLKILQDSFNIHASLQTIEEGDQVWTLKFKNFKKTTEISLKFQESSEIRKNTPKTMKNAKKNNQDRTSHLKSNAMRKS